MSAVRTEGQGTLDDCDVVVVGAGLAGASVAAGLAAEGQRVAVLEAGRVGGAATGRSTGLVLTGLPQHYSRTIAQFDRDKAREIWSLTTEGRDRLVERAESLGVSVERDGSLRMAVCDKEVQVLRESSDLLHEDGFDAWFGRRDPMGRGFLAALRYPDDVSVDAASLTQALLTSRDIVVHEGCEVRHIEADSGGLLVWSHRRLVRCSTVVLAVNGYASLMDPYFKAKVVPSRILEWITGPLDELLVDRPFTSDNGSTLCRQLSDYRLVLGQWQSRGDVRSVVGDDGRADEDMDDPLSEIMTSFLVRYFPELDLRSGGSRSGVTGATPDGLPIVGRLPHLPEIHFAVGFECYGLAWVLVAAQRVVDLVLRGNDPGILSAARFP